MIPNILTILRLISVPFILILAAGNSTLELGAALALFVLAAISDWLDGTIARARKEITLFGTVMDPVTDKILILGLLFVYHEKGLLPLWLVLVNLFRELFVSGLRQARAPDGRIVGATWMGKVKFVTQSIVIGWVLLYQVLESVDMSLTNKDVVYYSVLVMTIISVGLALNFFRWHSKGMLERRPDDPGRAHVEH